MNVADTSFSVNERDYRPLARPIVVVCIDGCSDEYLNHSMIRGRVPNLTQLATNGYYGLVRSALPSFTNVNNASIVTGRPPALHGICGNFFLDPATGEEVMMNCSLYLRAETILAAAAKAGRRVAMVTAKDKLREILSLGLTGISFSAEKANQATLEINGIKDIESLVGQATPPIYSAQASLFVLRAGVALLSRGHVDFLYLSLTDYMQHRYSPTEPESLDFYQAIDAEIGRLVELGAVVACTADHGMNAKTDAEGKPNVLYLETMLEKRFGPGTKVICPITDPYVVHHGALGSGVMVYLPDKSRVDEAARWLMGLNGISEVHDQSAAGHNLELPIDRIGDLFVLARRDYVLGKTPDDHDLSALQGPLRSHGGRYEEMVPLLISEPLNGQYLAKASGDPRNFDVFDFACNGVKP